MSGKLTEEYQEQLEQWIGTGPKSFKLFYSFTRDGCNSSTFHNKCNNQGPTVTVVYNTNNTVYGGYTSCSWTSNGNYSNDGMAFLFQLCYNGESRYIKFPIKQSNTNYATYNHNSYGPSFGGNNGYDMQTFSGSINNYSGQFQLNGSSELGCNYEMQGFSSNEFNNGHYSVSELEVYKVEVRTVAKKATKRSEAPVQTPSVNVNWRETPEWKTEILAQLKEEIENYQPLDQMNVPQVNILLIGPTGAGKSSFFNTINSIFRGRLTQQSCSGSSEQSLTTVYRQYQVRSSSGKPLKFRLCDTRGLEEGQGLDVNDVNHLLEGHVPNKYKFNPSSAISSEIAGFVDKPQLKDKIHCAAFVVDGSTIDVCPEKIAEKIKRAQTMMNQQNIPQVVLVTKVDKLDKELEGDISTLFRSDAVRKAVEKVSQVIGLPRCNVIPVMNYEQQSSLNTATSILALSALRQILGFADDFLYNCLDDLEAEVPLQVMSKDRK